MSADELVVGPDVKAQAGATQEKVSARLVVRGLEIRLTSDDSEVVSDVSFSVRAGEVLGVVGESGSGKTTVALALLGYARRGLRFSSGEILLDGANLLSMSPHELRAIRGAKVSYVPQDPAAALNPTLKIGTQLKEALTSHPETIEGEGVARRVVEVLQEVHLDANSEMLGVSRTSFRVASSSASPSRWHSRAARRLLSLTNRRPASTSLASGTSLRPSASSVTPTGSPRVRQPRPRRRGRSRFPGRGDVRRTRHRTWRDPPCLWRSPPSVFARIVGGGTVTRAR